MDKLLPIIIVSINTIIDNGYKKISDGNSGLLVVVDFFY